MRLEKDSVGYLEIPDESYYGVHTQRAVHNFNITGRRLDKDFIISLAEVKKALAQANYDLGVLSEKKMTAITKSAEEIIGGKLHDEILVDPIQGGAGTSSNMNINEVIANRAIELLGGTKGDYDLVNPNDDVNKGQSTNDIYPTAGKLTMLKKIPKLMEQLYLLRDTFLEKSKEFDDVIKLGRTQLQDAVPITLGQEFHAYYSVIKRGIKRLETAKKEMESINLGGTAIGTGISAHPKLSETVLTKLVNITGEPLEISDDLVDATQNVENYVVLSDALKAIAISLSKIANDIRLLSSGPKTGIGEIKIPAKQNGSSIMPGKINPVIPEVMNQCSFLVMGNNVTIGLAAEHGQLELNAFEPIIFYKLIESFEVLTHGVETFNENCVKGIEADRDRCRENLERSTYMATPLAEKIGYARAADIAKESVASGRTVKEIAKDYNVPDEVLDNLKVRVN
ncbi:aspartate ammonia-lyase [Vagococcus xieshaowenii]|uniref:Aspartate ammonia-lyase n=1 Tax=Vagococcus xieshaowenii TaxID=2562451 RepID=A0AAJ5EDX9_9ENTE|nr:aspartate ammonia-lyase [Vagococcus xieshaowenii]QCA28562.1 aspartate ammonia-lyase [Vagococcus xieshaowenii]TFZ40630.1 aspartate ammonia-lyase [Vagococcus xieshaowenii]